MVSNVDTSDDDELEVEEGSQTELDFHVNMPVVGRYAYVILDMRHIDNAKPFMPDYNSMQVPVYGCCCPV